MFEIIVIILLTLHLIFGICEWREIKKQPKIVISRDYKELQLGEEQKDLWDGISI